MMKKLKNSKSKSEKLRAEKSIDFWKKNPRYSITLEKI